MKRRDALPDELTDEETAAATAWLNTWGSSPDGSDDTVVILAGLIAVALVEELHAIGCVIQHQEDQP
jgi:NADPH:quinone reductase-like Zn-dependent oxidoreductase